MKPRGMMEQLLGLRQSLGLPAQFVGSVTLHTNGGGSVEVEILQKEHRPAPNGRGRVTITTSLRERFKVSENE